MGSSLSGSPDHNADYGRQPRIPRKVRQRRIEQWLEEQDELLPHVQRHQPGQDVDEWVACWSCCRFLTVSLYLHNAGRLQCAGYLDCAACGPTWEVNYEEDGAPLSEEADRF